jgi:multidrug efflux pump subunit AcrB
LRFPYTFYVLAAFIVFLGVSAVAVMSEDIFPEIGIPVMSVICAIRGAIPAGIQPSTWRRPW